MATLTTNEVLAKLLKEIHSYVQANTATQGDQVKDLNSITIGNTKYTFVAEGPKAIHGVDFLGNFDNLNQITLDKIGDHYLASAYITAEQKNYLFFSYKDQTERHSIGVFASDNCLNYCIYNNGWGSPIRFLDENDSTIIFADSEEEVKTPTNKILFQIIKS